MNMKALSLVAGVLGLAVAILVIAQQNLGEVEQLLGQAGFGLLWIVPFHALPLWLDTLGWRVLLAPRDPGARARTPYLFWVATVREAANRLLPVANVGGEIVGIRLVALRGLDGAAVSASVIVEVLLTMINQYLFTALGLVLLIALTGATGLAWTLVLGLVLSLPVPILLGLLLRYGAVFTRMEKIVERMLGDKLGSFGGSSLDAEIKALYARRVRLLGGLLWQFAGYLVGTFETWLVLALLGHPVSPWTAIAVEATTQALRHFVFFVPAGIGVQEAGLVLFGELVGIGNEVAVALSLAKRMREVLFGLPALVSWQWVEGARLRGFFSRRGAVQSPAEPRA